MEENEESVGIQRAAYRKLNHELGIYPSQLGRMHIMGKFLYKAKSDDVWSEHEMDYAIVISNFEGNINPNPEEVSDTRYVNQEELISLMSNNSFSPWFRLFHSHKWLSLWWNTLENLELNKESSAIHKLN